MKFKISFSLLLLLSLALLNDLHLFPLILSVAVHEGGHILTVKMLGGRVSDFKADLRGIEFKVSGLAFLKRHETILVNLSGPLAGLFLAFTAYFWNKEELFKVSLWLSLFNLLPIEGLDGGEIVRALKNKKR